MADDKHAPKGESAPALEKEDSPKRSPSPDDDAGIPTSSTSKAPQTAENRLRPAADILNRLIWDENYDSTEFVIGYEDRFEGRLEASLNSWKRESTDEEFIPQHRILYIKRKSDSEVVWDRRRRIDKIFMSGNSAFDYLAFLA
ncbi:DUF504 domain-containing protein [Aspergillus mulundensis]|uniref:MJ1316 RNA cyclic group end recognition domain-containing protein n=1 Tax=Aspergillus mulundensis TaxID=1810919 RepID=A0A3D8SVE3_9EURO|nr:Uncharacterized protein DSM5745_02014 [Aspergillus mulundensis]RDW90239.1 Uncharacterized protein DSM5745_02014 [Aspergillus mulundensis]